VSAFYEAMDLYPELVKEFKAVKREFKRGQGCAVCHVKLAQHLMTVDHIIPLSNPDVDPFDMTNWQVLCLTHHREKTKKENEELKRLKIEAAHAAHMQKAGRHS